ncbi:exoenzyme T [Vibrio ichthyoenteri ATCC 700023]|uniref:Exoenzyme T n=2 Tax=Vibrio ichthyoenteri TaxID=142461 RepID=F9S2C8_9VIBR|nr:exoenzyme T [Vibrio ichthyoenteri ATCC 700023]
MKMKDNVCNGHSLLAKDIKRLINTSDKSYNIEKKNDISYLLNFKKNDKHSIYNNLSTTMNDNDSSTKMNDNDSSTKMNDNDSSTKMNDNDSSTKMNDNDSSTTMNDNDSSTTINDTGLEYEENHTHILSKNAIDAIDYYTGGFEYRKLNSALRENLPLNDEMLKVISGLNELFTKKTSTDRIIKTFRGVFVETDLSHINEGDTVEIKGYLSTSRLLKVANLFMGDESENKGKAELNIIFGKSSYYIAEHSRCDYEEEELYPHGLKLKKVFQYHDGKKQLNVLEEVAITAPNNGDVGISLDLATDRKTDSSAKHSLLRSNSLPSQKVVTPIG